jgi:hypothetical protein
VALRAKHPPTHTLLALTHLPLASYLQLMPWAQLDGQHCVPALTLHSVQPRAAAAACTLTFLLQLPTCGLPASASLL